MFNCLEIPNDEVRLEVVKCLFHVPLEEFDVDEIAVFIKFLSTQNIGAGNTEIILSYIYWTLTKLLLDRSSESGKIFRSKYGETSIIKSFAIL